jgi:hypothetical protein
LPAPLTFDDPLRAAWLVAGDPSGYSLIHPTAAEIEFRNLVPTLAIVDDECDSLSQSKTSVNGFVWFFLRLCPKCLDCCQKQHELRHLLPCGKMPAFRKSFESSVDLFRGDGAPCLVCEAKSRRDWPPRLLRCTNAEWKACSECAYYAEILTSSATNYVHGLWDFMHSFNDQAADW